MSRSRKLPKQNDELLKGAFEENFSDFLQFLYPDADNIFDLSKGIVFMDKELLAIVPDRERKKGKRIADLLAKLYLKDGSEKHILLNTEIEGGNDVKFGERLYEYNYRIWDRYRIAVATIAVYIGGDKQPKPNEYRRYVLDTSLQFRYRAYHIFEHGESELLAMDNIFALIVLACQKAQLEGKIADAELGRERSTIARAIIASGKYDKGRIISFLLFLKNFLYINDPKINIIFDEEIIQISGGTINMGVLEVLRKQERERLVQEVAEQKSRDFVRNLILSAGFSDEKAAKIAEVSIGFVKKVRKAIEAEK